MKKIFLNLFFVSPLVLIVLVGPTSAFGRVFSFSEQQSINQITSQLAALNTLLKNLQHSIFKNVTAQRSPVNLLLADLIGDLTFDEGSGTTTPLT